MGILSRVGDDCVNRDRQFKGGQLEEIGQSIVLGPIPQLLVRIKFGRVGRKLMYLDSRKAIKQILGPITPIALVRRVSVMQKRNGD